MRAKALTDEIRILLGESVDPFLGLGTSLHTKTSRFGDYRLRSRLAHPLEDLVDGSVRIGLHLFVGEFERLDSLPPEELGPSLVPIHGHQETAT